MKKHRTMLDRSKEYLEHRRALGFALKGSGTLLLQFARFADRSKHRGPLTADLALRWAVSQRLPLPDIERNDSQSFEALPGTWPAKMVAAKYQIVISWAGTTIACSLTSIASGNCEN